VLEPWYAQPDLDPDMLAQARSDFGEMFLTPALLQQHSPWND
jgi:hypothetical protein